MNTKDFITTGTARDILGVSQQYVYALMKDNKLSVKIIGGVKFLKRTEVEKFANARKADSKV